MMSTFKYVQFSIQQWIPCYRESAIDHKCSWCFNQILTSSVNLFYCTEKRKLRIYLFYIRKTKCYWLWRHLCVFLPIITPPPTPSHRPQHILQTDTSGGKEKARGKLETVNKVVWWWTSQENLRTFKKSSSFELSFPKRSPGKFGSFSECERFRPQKGPFLPLFSVIYLLGNATRHGVIYLIPL